MSKQFDDSSPPINTSYYPTSPQILHDGAPESSLESVQKVLAAELGAPPEEIFSEFDPIPLGECHLTVVRSLLDQCGLQGQQTRYLVTEV